jgi:hypothetical protein
MTCTCPNCGKRFEVELQQDRAIRARWASTSKATRVAAAKRQAAARWGTKVTLDFGRKRPTVDGYIKHKKGQFGTSYRIKGDQEWRTTPNGDLIGKIFYVHGHP